MRNTPNTQLSEANIEAIERRIEEYKPASLDSATWQQIAPDARNLVRLAEPHSDAHAKELLGLLCDLVAQLDPDHEWSALEDLLTERHLTRYLSRRRSTLREGTLQARRSWGRRLLRAINGSTVDVKPHRRPGSPDLRATSLSEGELVSIAASVVELDADASAAFWSLLLTGFSIHQVSTGWEELKRDRHVPAILRAAVGDFTPAWLTEPVNELAEPGAEPNLAAVKRALRHLKAAGHNVTVERLRRTHAAAILGGDEILATAIHRMNGRGIALVGAADQPLGIAEAMKTMANLPSGTTPAFVGIPVRSETAAAGRGRKQERSMTKRKSRAATKRRMAEIRAERNAVPVLCDHLAELRAGYVPRDAAVLDNWDCVHPVWFEIMERAADSQSGSVFIQDCGIVARYVHWASRNGIELGAATLMTSERIERYCAGGLPGVEERSKAAYRAKLRALARRFPDSGVDKPRPVSHRAVAPPYTPTEVIRNIDIAHNQPGEATRAALLRAMALGLGAGCNAADLRIMRRSDIDQTEAGIMVNVPARTGVPARAVPLLSCFEDMLAEGLKPLSKKALILGKQGDQRNVTEVYDRAVLLGGAAKPDQTRMRNTWLASHLARPVPLQALLEAAGLKGAKTLVELLPYVADADAECLRGSAS